MSAEPQDGDGFEPTVDQVRVALRNCQGFCEANVIRDFEDCPCDKPAVALTAQVWDGEPLIWEVCAYHTRKATTVPLTLIVGAMRP